MWVVSVAIGIPNPTVLPVDYKLCLVALGLRPATFNRFALRAMNGAGTAGAFAFCCPPIIVRDDVNITFLAHLKLPLQLVNQWSRPTLRPGDPIPSAAISAASSARALAKRDSRTYVRLSPCRRSYESTDERSQRSCGKCVS
jgi:hypothetical protein